MPGSIVHKRFVDAVKMIRMLLRKEAVDQEFYQDLLGIAYQTWNKIDNLKRKPTYDQLISLVFNQYYPVNVMWLFYGKGEMFIHDEHDHSYITAEDPMEVDYRKMAKMERIINYIKKELEE